MCTHPPHKLYNTFKWIWKTRHFRIRIDRKLQINFRSLKKTFKFKNRIRIIAQFATSIRFAMRSKARGAGSFVGTPPPSGPPPPHRGPLVCMWVSPRAPQPRRRASPPPAPRQSHSLRRCGADVRTALRTDTFPKKKTVICIKKYFFYIKQTRRSVRAAFVVELIVFNVC